MLELFAANPQCPLLQGGGGGWRCTGGGPSSAAHRHTDLGTGPGLETSPRTA